MNIVFAWLRNLFNRNGTPAARLDVIKGGREELAREAARAMFTDFHSPRTAELFEKLEAAQRKPNRFNTSLRRVK
ncbi:hypothetical protein [Aromatoleum evansii]|uniref:hypothetical protein n=1 Tax=Aromatoleum evansii TaxID=59406 RepID=UPI00145E17ED|nr:hypothetical protein [Aromatoleum evansii]NMG29545.1 hypothetical protein [Aromatoleum evansii]